MTQEDKELLLKDLCARLPYGVKVRYSSYKEFITCTLHSINPIYNIIDLWSKDACFNSVSIRKIKPYLFPLSSMTEEQKKELEDMGWSFDNFEINNINECMGTYREYEYISHSYCFALTDWLNKNHFDYRYLIKKDLAIDATGLNIY